MVNVRDAGAGRGMVWRSGRSVRVSMGIGDMTKRATNCLGR